MFVQNLPLTSRTPISRISSILAGVPRNVIEAFSTRCAEIEAAMAARELGTPAANQPLAQRAALMTRAHKREVDSEALRENWEKQAVDLGFEARALAAEAIANGGARGRAG